MSSALWWLTANTDGRCDHSRSSFSTRIFTPARAIGTPVASEIAVCMPRSRFPVSTPSATPVVTAAFMPASAAAVRAVATSPGFGGLLRSRTGHPRRRAAARRPGCGLSATGCCTEERNATSS